MRDMLRYRSSALSQRPSCEDKRKESLKIMEDTKSRRDQIQETVRRCRLTPA